jgi:uncharacterized protein YkwD/uncharacterized membrane protein required for colicin V production
VADYTQAHLPPWISAVPENWVDIAILLVVAWNLADGIRRGFIGSVADLLAFILAVLASVTFYVQLADFGASQWTMPRLLARPLAFAVLWVVTSTVAGWIGRVVGAPFAALLRGSALDTVLSIVPAAAKGFLVAGFILTIILAVPPLAEGMPGQREFARVREAIQGSTLAGELVQRTAAFDRMAREIVGEPVSETLTLLTVKPETDERKTLDFRIENPAIDAAAEERMFELVNEERRKAGLRLLVRDPAIDRVARAYSIEMLQRGYFSHETPEGLSPFDRMRAGGVDFVVAGENLALAPTVGIAHQGLMDSPGHRANILRPEFGRVGIGAAAADGRGRMFVQNFAN